MNKYRVWQLIIVMAMIAIAFVPNIGGTWGIIILFVIFLILQDYCDNIKASDILNKWLSDKRISYLLEQSNISDFIVLRHPSVSTKVLNPYSKHVRLLKEYLGSVKINQRTMKLALDLYYNKPCKKEINEISKLDYEKFRHDLENQSVNPSAKD